MLANRVSKEQFSLAADMHAIAAMFWKEIVIFAPTAGIKLIFAAAAAAQAIPTVMAGNEGLELPEDSNNTLNKYFPHELEFLRDMRSTSSDKLMERQRKKAKLSAKQELLLTKEIRFPLLCQG